jgi:hypothetical protein
VSKARSAVLTRVPLAIHRTVLAECPKHLCCSCFGTRGGHPPIDYGCPAPHRENGWKMPSRGSSTTLTACMAVVGVLYIGATKPRRREVRGAELSTVAPSSYCHHTARVKMNQGEGRRRDHLRCNTPDPLSLGSAERHVAVVHAATYPKQWSSE